MDSRKLLIMFGLRSVLESHLKINFILDFSDLIA